MRLDHVAVLVEDIEATVAAWELPDAQTIEEFPSEGTRELYCGTPGQSGRVLLMQSIGPGPYERAMSKRGAGLHHIAFSVDDLIDFVSTVADSGWLLHPKSLETYASSQQVWLCRPGFPCLVELNERAVTYDGSYASEVAVSAPEVFSRMIDRFECEALLRTTEPKHVLVVAGRRIWID